MSHLVWTAELDTGIHEIDVQHRRIVDYINRLHDARTTHDLEEVKAVIEEAVDYTLSHFAFEEALMVDAGYMYAGPHKKVHELFTRKVAEFQARMEGGEDISAELHAMLSRWLFNHIRNDDASYAGAVAMYMKMRQGGGTDDVKAQIKDELIRELHLNEHPKKGWLARLLGL